jgi:hypothetical protein
MELVPTSKTPHPQAQACTILGASIPANKPQLTFTVTAELNLFFIFNIWKLRGRATWWFNPSI